MNPQAPPDSTWARFGGVATIVLTLLGWSSIPLFLKSFTGDIDAWTANGWRYGLSALMWAPVLVWAYARRTMPRGLWKAAIVPSLFNTIGQMLFGLAPYYVDPGLMTFALRVQIVFVTVGAAVLFASERRVVRHPAFLLGLGLVFAGTMGTIALKPGGLGEGTTLGIALSILSGLLYACYSLSVRHFMHGVNPLVAFAVISQYTAVGLIVPMLFVGNNGGADVFGLSAGKIGMLALSSIIGIGLGHTFYYISIARLGVAVSAGVIQLQPFIVAAASFFIFGERLAWAQWASGAAAVAGAAFILVVQHRLSRSARGAAIPLSPNDLPDVPCPEEPGASATRQSPDEAAVVEVKAADVRC